jgi:hypothetical protein
MSFSPALSVRTIIKLCSCKLLRLFHRVFFLFHSTLLYFFLLLHLMECWLYSICRVKKIVSLWKVFSFFDPVCLKSLCIEKKKKDNENESDEKSKTLTLVKRKQKKWFNVKVVIVEARHRVKLMQFIYKLSIFTQFMIIFSVFFFLSTMNFYILNISLLSYDLQNKIQ